MANPKRRHSKQRTATRRSHHRVEQKNIAACNNCGSPKLSHRVCPECGFYRGQLAVENISAQ